MGVGNRADVGTSLDCCRADGSSSPGTKTGMTGLGVLLALALLVVSIYEGAMFE
ncbi:MAG: hypothetical protein QOI57_2878 [Rubrobacteraceae bacterium]|nr:hypothetical protein [Rubrobacteraceae bacterium]